MKFIWVLLGLTILSIASGTASAGDSQVITITAQPWSEGDCPTNFTFNAVSSYEVQLSWTPGGNTTATMIRGAYARWPNSPSDGFEVYHGNSSSVSHWLTTDVMILSDEGIYYRAWGELGNGSWSLCYAAGSIVGGEGMTNIGSGVILLPLIIFALGSTVSAYAFRKTPIAMVAAAAWAVLGFYSFTQSASSNPTVISDFWMALFWVGMAMIIVSIFEPAIMKPPSKELEDLDKIEPEEESLSSEYARLRKEMGLGIFRTRKRKGLRPG